MKILRGPFRKLLTIVIIIVLFGLVYFPGQQTPIAFTLATGIGVNRLQSRVDELEGKAISGAEFTDNDTRFLSNLYTCFAKGARLTIVLRQSSQMMDRYLSMSGKDLKTSPRIFINSSPVQVQIGGIRELIEKDLVESVLGSISYSSEVFYMGDPKFFDSFIGLYFGHITGTVHQIDEHNIKIVWRAECPWQWPSYDSLHDKYGDHHAQCFPLPNAKSLLLGAQHCLRLDDGLGGHLERINIAKPFLVWAEWEEKINMANQSMEAIVTTPVNEVELVCTQAHP